MSTFLVVWLLVVSFLANSFVVWKLTTGLSFKKIILRTYKFNSLSALGAVAISSYILGWIVFPLNDITQGTVLIDNYYFLVYLLALLLLYLFSRYFLSVEVENESLGSWLLLAQLGIGIVGYFGFKYLGMF